MFTPELFILESNKIEGIHRPSTQEEIEEYHRFMARSEIIIKDLETFISIYQPDAELRDRPGLNVKVGNHYPPLGGIEILTQLLDILADGTKHIRSFTPDILWKHCYNIHQRYETLHPFTDGNGRSGRMLWMWMMREAPLGFLHTWYYQSLTENRR